MGWTDAAGRAGPGVWRGRVPRRSRSAPLEPWRDECRADAKPPFSAASLGLFLPGDTAKYLGRLLAYVWAEKRLLGIALAFGIPGILLPFAYPKLIGLLIDKVICRPPRPAGRVVVADPHQRPLGPDGRRLDRRRVRQGALHAAAGQRDHHPAAERPVRPLPKAVPAVLRQGADRRHRLAAGAGGERRCEHRLRRHPDGRLRRGPAVHRRQPAAGAELEAGRRRADPAAVLRLDAVPDVPGRAEGQRRRQPAHGAGERERAASSSRPCRWSRPTPPRTGRRPASRPRTASSSSTCSARASWATGWGPPATASSTWARPSSSASAGSWCTTTPGSRLGQWSQFLGYVGIMYGPVKRFADLNLVYQNSWASVRRVFRVFDIRPKIVDKPDCHHAGAAAGRGGVRPRPLPVRRRQRREPDAAGRRRARRQPVQAGRPGRPRPPARRPVHPQRRRPARPGRRADRPGRPVGSGKTTLASLLPRLFDVQRGPHPGRRRSTSATTASRPCGARSASSSRSRSCSAARSARTCSTAGPTRPRPTWSPRPRTPTPTASSPPWPRATTPPWASGA